MFHFLMLKHPSRRAFLQTAPLAAALALSDSAISGQTTTPEAFKLIPASQFTEALGVMKQKPGTFGFYDVPTMPFTAVLTYEEKHAAKEFEWHEGRDHLVQVVDGSATYELGGTPQNSRNTRPGEWLAPASEGATTLKLKKGDWLIIPRGTPHRRTTERSITFFLISTTGK